MNKVDIFNFCGAAQIHLRGATYDEFRFYYRTLWGIIFNTIGEFSLSTKNQVLIFSLGLSYYHISLLAKVFLCFVSVPLADYATLKRPVFI